MKWFKHDTDASIDAKLQELLLDYGASGYGLYWYCVELIAQNVNENNITFELEHDARIIARNLNLTIQETKDMMSKMIYLDLFSLSKNNKLACYALAKRLDQSMTSSSRFRGLISQIKDNNHDLVMTESAISHDKVMQEEKRREEKRIEFTFSLEKTKLLSSTSKEYKQKLEEYIKQSGKKMTYQEFFDKCEMKPYKYKNFKMAYDNWNKEDKQAISSGARMLGGYIV